MTEIVIDTNELNTMEVNMSYLKANMRLAAFIYCYICMLAGVYASEQHPAAGISMVPTDSRFLLFSDTQVAYYHIFDSREPGVTGGRAGDAIIGRSIPKQVLNISHADAWNYGTNFFSLDILKSGSQDPAGVLGQHPVLYDYGATEAYGVYRGTLGVNEISQTKIMELSGIIKNLSFGYGADLGTKNNQFGSETRKFLAGAVFALDVPVGFANLGIYVQKEWNRNGFVTEPFRSVDYNPVPHFELVYNFPLDFLQIPLSIAGYNNINLPKGKNGFGDQTKLEFLSRTNLVLDVGKLIWGQPNRLDAFVGFQYWRNKFGYDQKSFPGSEEKAFLAGVSIHLF